MRAHQAQIPTPAEIEASAPLRETAFHSRSQGILCGELRRLLALPRRLEGLVVGLQPDRELAWSSSGALAANRDQRGADLQGANLYYVDLQMANLSETKLIGSNFLGAKIGGTILGDVDLSTVYELETVAHQGPSTISIDTLYRSRGQIPEVFLRRTGVPEDIITHVRALVERPFEFYSCFISY